MAEHSPQSPRTRIAQALHSIDKETGAVVPPIHPASTYARDESNQLVGRTDYRRPDGENSVLAAAMVAELEGATASQLYASGLAAAHAIFETVGPRGKILAQNRMYHGTRKLLMRLAQNERITLEWFDPDDKDALASAISSFQPELVWIETPGNPVWSIIDIRATAKAAHEAGSILAVDGTCAPPCTSQPLSQGADYVMHSATKYLNGHSDVLAGVVSTSRTDERWEKIIQNASLFGPTPGAFEAWLLVRGMRTLFVRYDQQSRNAIAIAEAMKDHPAVESVLYPGLADHPGHEIAARQMTNGFGGLLSLLLKGGPEAAGRVAGSTKVFIQATSIGGVESLIEHRHPIEGPDTLCPPELLRLSVGIEDVDDLIADLKQALDQV